jgi:hypothetical protein
MLRTGLVALVLLASGCRNPGAPEPLEPWETTGWTQPRTARQEEAARLASRDAEVLGLPPVQVEFELWSPRSNPAAVGWVHWPEVDAGLFRIHLRADYFEECVPLELAMRVGHEVCHLRWGPDEELAEACAWQIRE